MWRVGTLPNGHVALAENCEEHGRYKADDDCDADSVGNLPLPGDANGLQVMPAADLVSDELGFNVHGLWWDWVRSAFGGNSLTIARGGKPSSGLLGDNSACDMSLISYA